MKPKELEAITASISEITSKVALLDQKKAYSDLENPKKLDMLDNQIESTGTAAALAQEQLQQFIDSKGKLLKKLDGEVNALNMATNKVLSEIAILKSQYETMEARRDKDLALVDEQISKVQSETAMVDEQKAQLVVSVADNKLIRSMQAQADMLNGITMAQLSPTSNMFYEFYKIANTLSGLDTSSGFDTGSDDTTLIPVI